MKDIYYINRQTGEKIKEIVPGQKTMNFLYGNKRAAKLNLFLLFKRKYLSQFGGLMMQWSYSKRRIPDFIKTHQLNMDEFEVPQKGYKNFNQFFYRKLKTNSRKIDAGVVSPADGKIVVFNNIEEVNNFYIKDCSFNLLTFLKDGALAEKYKNGSMAIIRLAPADYHRFHFSLDGVPTASKKIKGYYYSVSPIALQRNMRIFCENKREYSLLKTEEAGEVLICEVGATLTGSVIQTYTPNIPVKKGDEKGHFAFGGSTVVLLFEANKIKFNQDLIDNTHNGYETEIKMGEQIAEISN
ncbi:MAG: phosphatidylserine decarboxylase [Putridiphycobacter sp.]